MKIRQGFVSNSSSSSFILTNYQLKKNQKLAIKIEREFQKILEYFNLKDRAWLIKEGFKDSIPSYEEENERQLKASLDVLKKINKIVNKMTSDDIENFFESEFEYRDKNDCYFNQDAWKRPPFSSRAYYLAQKLKKINSEIYKKVFLSEYRLECFIKNRVERKYALNRKRFIFNDSIWFDPCEVFQFQREIEEKYQLSKFEKNILNKLINQIVKEINLTFIKYIEKIKRFLKKEANNGIYFIELQDGGGSGIYAPWLEREILEFNYLIKINNH